MDNIYDVHQYSEEECYRILGLTTLDPTDNELEHTIQQQLDKYTTINTSNANPLRDFFQSMYDRFFEDDNEYDEQNEIRPYQEGFASMELDFSQPQVGISYETIDNPEINPTYIGRQGEQQTEDAPSQNDIITDSSGKMQIDRNNDGQIDEEDVYTQQYAQIITKDIDYTKGSLNPLLKETIKRTININSQDRDEVFRENNSLSTDFHFYLEETLRNVVSLKLYAVQIPFTWYTIDDSYGSNIVYLKSDTPGLIHSNHEYKIEIIPGNYKPNTLVEAVNNSFQTLIQNTPSVNFGNSSFSYESVNALSTFSLDIQKVYGTKEFQIEIERKVKTNADDSDFSYNDLATYMGFYNNHITEMKNVKQPNVTTNSNNNSSIEGTLKIVRYSTEFDSSGHIFDISNQRLDDTGLLKNEDLLLEIPIPASSTRQQAQPIINSYLQGSSSLLGSVDLSGSYFTWDITFNYENDCPLIYQKLALCIDNSNNEDFFGFSTSYQNQTNFPKYINICSSEYEYIIESQEPVVSEGLYNIGENEMKVFIRNETARTDFGVGTEFNSAVDISFVITNTSNKNTVEILDHITTDISNVSISNLEISGGLVETSLGDQYQIDVDVSLVLQGDANVFELSSDGGLINDFSGILYDVFLFRVNETDYDICGNYGVPFIQDVSSNYNNGGKHPRTTIDVSGDLLYTYTSLHPQLAKTSYTKTANHILSLKGGTYFPNLDISIDVSISGFLSTILDDIIDNNANNFKLLIQSEGQQNGLEITFNTEPQGSIETYGFTLPDEAKPGFYQTEETNKIYKSTLTIRVIKTFEVSDYSIVFSGDLWQSILKIDNSYNLLDSSSILGDIIDYNNRYVGIDKTINFNSILSSDIVGITPFTITTPQNYDETTDIPERGYLIEELIEKINELLNANPSAYGSYFETFTNNSKTYVRGYINLTKVFTTKDYKLVLYDAESFESCNSSSNYFRVAKSNTTLGFILGFRSLTEYSFASYTTTIPSKNQLLDSIETINYRDGLESIYQVSIRGDTVVSVSLYNSLMIVLEDYNQNHMNDGLVSITQRDTKASLPYYALRNLYNCNPETSEILNSGLNGRNLTNNQLYSLTQQINAQNSSQKTNKVTTSLKDVFAIVPVKYGLNAGDIFVEFGGTLQAQAREYFGPVNISRLRVKLLTDKGDVINLNGADWSFQIICEQLYKRPESNSESN